MYACEKRYLTMIVRIGSIEELKLLWENNNSPTQRYFINGIEKGDIEFWIVEDEENRRLVGELYIFWDSEDKDEANGKDRAYLCAFRINEDYRGRGLGSKLMKGVLERVVEKGFHEITIGVDNNDADRLSQMYKSWGFSQIIKCANIDYHFLDINNQPMYYKIPYALYLNRLDNVM
jgi:ribosomal protein S18 acetylase RimI-like enzyme